MSEQTDALDAVARYWGFGWRNDPLYLKAQHERVILAAEAIVAKAEVEAHKLLTDERARAKAYVDAWRRAAQ